MKLILSLLNYRLSRTFSMRNLSLKEIDVNENISISDLDSMDDDYDSVDEDLCTEKFTFQRNRN